MIRLNDCSKFWIISLISFHFKSETTKKDKPTPEKIEEPQSCAENTSNVCSSQLTEICIHEDENVQFPNVKEDENLDFDYFAVSVKEKVVSTKIGSENQQINKKNHKLDQIKKRKKSNATPSVLSIWRPFEDIYTWLVL